MTRTRLAALIGLICLALALAFSVVVFAQNGSEPVDPNNPAPALTHEFGNQPAIADELTDAQRFQVGSAHTDGEGAPDVVGAFRMICLPVGVKTVDPVVYPGQKGRSHAHQFFGNMGVTENSTYASLRTSGESGCHNRAGGWRSAYWIPAMVNGAGKVIQPEDIAIYYKRWPLSSKYCTPGNPDFKGTCIPLPNGIRFVAGYDFLTGTVDNGDKAFKCVVNLFGGGQQVGPEFPLMYQAAATCPSPPSAGDQYMDVVLSAPHCLQSDGQGGIRLDSPNHRSHTSVEVVEPGTGKSRCPKSHPYATWSYTLQIFYKMDDSINRSGTWVDGQDTWYFSTDRMDGLHSMAGIDRVMHYPPGTTLHFDLFDAADTRTKKMIEDNCINRFLNCSGGDLGNGLALRDTIIIPRPQINRIIPRPKLRSETFTAKVIRDK